MLKRLSISNFALINQMNVEFPGSLTVITGETGAGKSIFLEALGLALGKRAEQGVLKNKSKKCIVEAEFVCNDTDMAAFFEENELDFEKQILLRREISAEGKSRSFLNDCMVSLNVLKQLSEKLVDIHSQHQTLLLNQSNFQIELLDAFAGTLDLHKTYKAEFGKLNNLQQRLQLLLQQELQAKKELDYFQFLFQELEAVEIKTGMLKLLEEESSTLENAEIIKGNLFLAAEKISGGEDNILSNLSLIKQSLGSVSGFSSKYKELFDRLNSVYIDLKEMASELGDAAGDVQVDNTQLEIVNEKLDKLNRLLKKHNVRTEQELIAVKEEIESKLLQFTSLENEIEKINREISSIIGSCTRIAKDLTRLRVKSAPKIETEVKEMLAGLSMENAKFKIEIAAKDELSNTGLDHIKFLFSANKGIGLDDIQKVASGGELSRLMLSLKAMMASKKNLPTIIFDEIDTGVSGDVADKIGNILLKMGAEMQVVAITHLPQIASKGGHHLFVYKNEDEDQTVSQIRQLTKEERVNEIAKMLSNSNPTISALKNAKELLNA
jgi:DNA repair protein RecN (Recombination protein N)